MNSTNHNTIDVVIPVYNGENFILKALESAANQTLPPRSIIVVDDGSNDNTYSMVTEYAQTSPLKIKLIKKENGGLSSARNAGILESTADLIAFLDADDMWLLNKLEEQSEIYNATKFKNLALVYCDYDVIDTGGNIKYQNYKAPLDNKRMRGMVFKKLLERNQIASSGSGVLIKREVFDTVGLFDEKLKFAEDWDMWLRIAKKFEVDFVPKVLVHIRKHPQNMTYDSSKTFRNELDFYNKWISIIDGQYPVPLFWADKITFRILSRLPKTDFISTLQSSMPTTHYQKMFRKSFGSMSLYIPIFLLRQTYNTLFYPNYLSIVTGFIKHTGK